MNNALKYKTSALVMAAIGAVGFAQPSLSQDVASDQATEVVTEVIKSEKEKLPEGQSVEMGSGGEISITVVDLDIARVLQLLSMQSQRNIIASKSVSGNISVAITNADFYEALDAVLAPNGFGFLEKGSFIYVYTMDEIREMEEAARVAIYEIVKLNYISASDAAEFVAPLLSEKGTVAVSGDVVTGTDVSLSDSGANTFSHQDTLMIRDYEENVEQILAVVKQLDTRPQQVKIEATILEAILTDETSFGIDFALFTNLDFATLYGPFAALGNGATTGGGLAGESTAGVGADSGGLKVGVSGSSGSILVSALDSITDTTLLANPQILVLNRQRAKLHVGAKLGYITTTKTDVSDSETVDYLEIGTTLNVRPFVAKDGFVRMELTPSISDGSTSESSTGSIIPNTTIEELTTNVIVKSGQTVVLGGLFKEDTEVGRRQIPWAGDIPVAGLLGSNKNTKSERTEVIFMIKPTIMNDQILVQEGDAAVEATQRVRVGSRNSLLPFSRTAMLQGYLKSAYEALDQDDLEKAEWYVDLALYLNPMQAEAIRLREKISGTQPYYMKDSSLDFFVDEMLDGKIDALKEAREQEQAAAEAEEVEAKLDSVETATVEQDVNGTVVSEGVESGEAESSVAVMDENEAASDEKSESDQGAAPAIGAVMTDGLMSE